MPVFVGLPCEKITRTLKHGSIASVNRTCVRPVQGLVRTDDPVSRPAKSGTGMASDRWIRRDQVRLLDVSPAYRPPDQRSDKIPGAAGRVACSPAACAVHRNCRLCLPEAASAVANETPGSAQRSARALKVRAGVALRPTATPVVAAGTREDDQHCRERALEGSAAPPVHTIIRHRRTCRGVARSPAAQECVSHFQARSRRSRSPWCLPRSDICADRCKWPDP
jgi:hypothetical protein